VSLTASRAVPEARSGVAAAARSAPAETIFVAILTVAVFAFRFTQLHQSLYGDEVWTYQDIVGRSLGSVLRTVHTGAENSPPLFFVLAWFSAKLGDPTVLIRLPSLILGTATIPLIYALGRETVGRIAGMIGAAVVAVSPFTVYYGIEGRPYATMAFFVALSTFALVKSVRSGSRWWWTLYALATAAAAYTHYTSIFVLAAQAAWSLWQCRDRLRQPLMANAVVALLYAPWVTHIRGKSLAVIALFEPLNVHNVVTNVLLTIPGYPYTGLRTIPTFPGLIVIGVCAMLGLVALVGRRRRSSVGVPKSEPSPHLGLIVGLALATPVGLLLYSLIASDLWTPRGLYASVPATALLLGALLAALPRSPRAVAVIAVLATLVFGSIRAISPPYARPPFRAIAAYLDRVAGPRDPIIMYPSFRTPAIRAQFHKPHPIISMSSNAWTSVPLGATAYVVIDNTPPVPYQIQAPNPRGFALVARRQYTGLASTELLTLRAPG
jgi:Dolichyl-phosphate-mannose-protein mannosyltransferase